MSYVASTITEHYINIGEERGKKIGEKIGEKIGILKGKLLTVQELYDKKVIHHDIFIEMSNAIEEHMKKLTTSSKNKRMKKIG